MGLLIQWIMFVWGERYPLGSEPLICGDDDPIIAEPQSGG
jgi:hypothetical protein